MVKTQLFFEGSEGHLRALSGSPGGPSGLLWGFKGDHESATGFPREIHDNLLDLDMQFTAFA